MLRFQIYTETGLAFKYNKPVYKTQYPEFFVEYEQIFDTHTGKLITIQHAAHQLLTNDKNPFISVHLLKNTGQTGGKVKPQHEDSTRLPDLSLMNDTYFGAIHCDFHLDIKLDYTKSRIFQEMSSSELETLHHLCELERTQILQSLALAVLKIPCTGYLLSENRSNFIEYEGNILWFTLVPKKYHPYTFLKIKNAIKVSQYSLKTKYNLLTNFHAELIFGIQPSHLDQKAVTMLYS